MERLQPHAPLKVTTNEPERRLKSEGANSVARNLFNEDESKTGDFSLHCVGKNEMQRAQDLRMASANQQYGNFRNYFKNVEEDISQEICRQQGKSRQKIEAWIGDTFGEEVLSSINENPPKSKAELLDLVVTAVALAKYGESDLVHKELCGEMIGLNNVAWFYDLRSSKQQQYRKESRSKQKEMKQTAHKLGLGVAKELLLALPPRNRPDAAVVRELLNDSNFRMVLTTTNQGMHKVVDAKLLGGVPSKLTDEERGRLGQIVKYVQSEDFQKFVCEHTNCEFLYDAIREMVVVQDRSAWDDSLDVPRLKRPNIRRREKASMARREKDIADHKKAQHLTKDGKPDRRFRENKIAKDPAKASPKTSTKNAVKAPVKKADLSAVLATGATKGDGTPDMRYRENKCKHAPANIKPSTASNAKPTPAVANGPLKNDGTPDKRFRENKTKPRANIESLTSDDMAGIRYSANKVAATANRSYPTASLDTKPTPKASSGPLKKDGTPDMRYSVNKVAAALAPPAPVTQARIPTVTDSFMSTSYSSGYAASSSMGSGGGRELMTGPRGGTYYINSNGNKSYVR